MLFLSLVVIMVISAVYLVVTGAVDALIVTTLGLTSMVVFGLTSNRKGDEMSYFRKALEQLKALYTMCVNSRAVGYYLFTCFMATAAISSNLDNAALAVGGVLGVLCTISWVSFYSETRHRAQRNMRLGGWETIPGYIEDGKPVYYGVMSAFMVAFTYWVLVFIPNHVLGIFSSVAPGYVLVAVIIGLFTIRYDRMSLGQRINAWWVSRANKTWFTTLLVLVLVGCGNPEPPAGGWDPHPHQENPKSHTFIDQWEAYSSAKEFSRFERAHGWESERLMGSMHCYVVFGQCLAPHTHHYTPATMPATCARYSKADDAWRVRNECKPCELLMDYHHGGEIKGEFGHKFLYEDEMPMEEYYKKGSIPWYIGIGLILGLIGHALSTRRHTNVWDRVLDITEKALYGFGLVAVIGWFFNVSTGALVLGASVPLLVSGASKYAKYVGFKVTYKETCTDHWGWIVGWNDHKKEFLIRPAYNESIMYEYACKMMDDGYWTRCFGNYGQSMNTDVCKRKDALDKAKVFVRQMKTGKWCNEHAAQATDLLFNIRNTFLDNYKGKTARLVQKDSKAYFTDGHAYILKTDEVGPNGDLQQIEVEFYESNAHHGQLSVRIKLYGQCHKAYLCKDIASMRYKDVMDTWYTPVGYTGKEKYIKKQIADFARNI